MPDLIAAAKQVLTNVGHHWREDVDPTTPQLMADFAAEAVARERGEIAGWLCEIADRITDQIKQLGYAEAELAQLRDENRAMALLLNEVMQWHSDGESATYNECEKSPCHWCEMATAVLKQGDK